MIQSISTNYLTIKKFAYSSYGLMTYQLGDIQTPLCLGVISVQRVAGEGVVAGLINQGTKGRPGRANLQVSREIYDALLAVSTSAGTHRIQLTYDEESLAPLALSVA
jgi:hypothetical protein